MRTRRCPRCRETKPVEDFYTGSSSCKRCRCVAEKARRDGPRREQILQRHRERTRANPQPNRDRARQWAADHQERRREIARNYTRRNKAAVYVRNKQWRIDKRDLYLAGKRRREAARKALKLGRDVERVDYERICRRDRMRCHICRTRVARKDLHFDHVIPLSKGGAHVESNIAVAHAKCNLRKRADVVTLF